MSIKIALITGVTGQDGSYLAEFLLEKGYKVIGVKRRTSIIQTERIDHIFSNPNFKMHYGNLSDAGSLWALMLKYEPDEIYNLAAQSHVRVSFDVPEETTETITMGTTRLLEAYRHVVPHAKFYQASSSEMFGTNPNPPYNEDSALCPASPYACAKVYAHHMINNYRNGYGLYTCSGILFNHESPRRGETFVTRKITLAAAKIKLGLQDKLFLGNLDSKRDWGFAGDYVRLMWMMLQQDVPRDYVIATGETHSVKEFLECVFSHAGLDVDKYVETDPRLFRPNEVPYLLGDASRARQELGWQPEVAFSELAKMMYESDLQKVERHVR